MNWNYPRAPVRPRWWDVGSWLIRAVGEDDQPFWDMLSTRARQFVSPMIWPMAGFALLAGYMPLMLGVPYLCAQVIWFCVMLGAAVGFRGYLVRSGRALDIAAAPLTGYDPYIAIRNHLRVCVTAVLLTHLFVIPGLFEPLMISRSAATLVVVSIASHFLVGTTAIAFAWIVIQFGWRTPLLMLGVAGALWLLSLFGASWNQITVLRELCGFAMYIIGVFAPLIIWNFGFRSALWCYGNWLNSLRERLDGR